MREEKHLLLDEITGLISHYHHFVIMSYNKLQANRFGNLRGNVQNLGGEIEIVSKRLLMKGAAAAGYELRKENLEGHIGIVFTNDAVEATKYIVQFGAENENCLTVLGGKIDGQLYSGAQMEKISKLPGMNELRAQFLSVLVAPLGHTLGVIDALLTSVIHCLANKADKEGGPVINILDDSQCSEVNCEQ